MVLAVAKNFLCHGTLTPKCPSNNHPPLAPNIAPGTPESPTNPLSSHTNHRQGNPDMGFVTSKLIVSSARPASPASAAEYETDIPVNEPHDVEMDAITAVSSPATAVQRSPSMSANDGHGCTSAGTSLDLGDREKTQVIPVDLEAQLQKTQSERKKSILYQRIIPDASIGLSDGLTVPFALTAGLSSVGDTHIVILGGVAELIAGCISMGLGGWLAAKGEKDAYTARVKKTQTMVETSPDEAARLVNDALDPYGLSPGIMASIFESLRESPENLVDFVVKFHYGMQEPSGARPLVSAFTIGSSYFIGGLVPLIPYLAVKKAQVLLALYWSIGVMVVALFAFGWAKTAAVSGWTDRANLWESLKGGFQMILIGGVAAGAAVGIVRGFHRALPT